MGCARKVDPSIWSILFEHSGSPITLFEVHQLPCAGERERVCVCVCVSTITVQCYVEFINLLELNISVGMSHYQKNC